MLGGDPVRKGIIITIFIVLISMVVLANEPEIIISDDGYEYEVLEDGIAKINAYYGGVADIIEIPDELGGYVVTSIGDYAFWTYDGSACVILPDTINSIGINPFYRSNEINFNISPDHPYLAVIDGALFSKPDKRLIYCPNEEYTYEVPDGTQIIGERAFSNCERLMEVVLPDSVTKIENFAFDRCINISSITFSDNINSMGTNPFTSNKKIEFNVSPDHPYLSVMDGVLFSKPDNRLVYSPDNKDDYVIPEWVQIIGGFAFYECNNLTSIVMPDSVMNIGRGSFLNCKHLKDITFSNCLENIEASAFAGCQSLVDVMLPESIESVGDLAFNYCHGMANIYNPDGVEYAECSHLKNLYLPTHLESIGFEAFPANSNLIITVNQGSFAECKFRSTGVPIPLTAA